MVFTKISIIGDCHCGFDFGGERGEDTFTALKEAVSRSMDADLIIQTGDLFDSRITRQEVFARVARILGRTKNVQSNVKLTELIGKNSDDLSSSALRGIPMVTIHGTHERRSKHLVNPIQALESAGLAIHLHGQTAVFEIGGRKVAIHGMSGVPERYAKDCLLKWNPKPVPGALNIFVFHQSIDPYIYNPLEPPALKLEDLPDGFDLFVLGHMHWHDHKLLRGSQLLLTGSLVPTALHKHEAKQTKGFWSFDGSTLAFNPLEHQRKVYYEDFEYSPALEQSVSSRLAGILSEQHGLKPIVYLRLRGKLPVGAPHPSLVEIQERFGDRLVLKINSKLESEDFERSGLLKTLRHSGLSPEEQGIKMLQENLDKAECGIKVDDIYELLVDGQIDTIFKALTSENSSETPSQTKKPDAPNNST